MTEELSLEQAAQRLLARHARHLGEISLLHLMRRMEQPVGQRPVVSQQQQSGSIIIKPPYRINALFNAVQQV